jgi:hypothetical protein
MLFTFPVTVCAEDVLSEPVETVQTESTVDDESSVEDPASEPEPPVPDATEGVVEEESVAPTVFTRVWEFVENNTQETLSIVGTVSLLIMNLILKHSGTKTSKETKIALENITGDVGMTLGGQQSVVEVVNRLIDGYNELSKRYDALKESYDKYGMTEDERNRVSGAVLATNTAILEILTTVYTNNRNLPQGVKDLVNLKYANCLKSLEDDERLIAIVEAVRTNIGETAESAKKDEVALLSATTATAEQSSESEENKQ